MEILHRYHALVSERNETYLWYFPDGRPAAVETSTSPEAQPTDGWGSSAMLYALVEGLAGIEDRGRCFDRLRLAPRWAAADLDEADVEIGYAASGARVGYHYEARGGTVRLELDTPTSEVACHLLLPEGARAERVRCGAQAVKHRETGVEGSRYVDFDADTGREHRDRPGGGPCRLSGSASSRTRSPRTSTRSAPSSMHTTSTRWSCAASRAVASPTCRRPTSRYLCAWAQAADPRILSVSPGIFKAATGTVARPSATSTDVLPRAIDLARRLDARYLVAFSFETLGEPLDPSALEALRAAAERVRGGGSPAPGRERTRVRGRRPGPTWRG